MLGPFETDPLQQERKVTQFIRDVETSSGNLIPTSRYSMDIRDLYVKSAQLLEKLFLTNGYSLNAVHIVDGVYFELSHFQTEVEGVSRTYLSLHSNQSGIFEVNFLATQTGIDSLAITVDENQIAFIEISDDPEIMTGEEPENFPVQDILLAATSAISDIILPRGEVHDYLLAVDDQSAPIQLSRENIHAEVEDLFADPLLVETLEGLGFSTSLTETDENILMLLYSAFHGNLVKSFIIMYSMYKSLPDNQSFLDMLELTQGLDYSVNGISQIREVMQSFFITRFIGAAVNGINIIANSQIAQNISSTLAEKFRINNVWRKPHVTLYDIEYEGANLQLTEHELIDWARQLTVFITAETIHDNLSGQNPLR